MSKTLEDLIEESRRITMTADQQIRQRQSFAYGNTTIENPAITREMVREQDARLKGGAAEPNGSRRTRN